MAPTPTSTVDTPQWWEIIAALNPLATLLAAVIAGLLAWRALRQRSLADRRSEWWSRAQWALDSSLSDEDDRREMGINVLLVLARSGLAGKEELDVLDAAWTEPLEEYREELDTMPKQGENGLRTTEEVEDERFNEPEQ